MSVNETETKITKGFSFGFFATLGALTALFLVWLFFVIGAAVLGVSILSVLL